MRVLFSGPVGEPERRVDLNPLLEVLRARYLQRQLDRIEELEAARRRAEAAARALSVPQPGAPRRPVPTPAAAPLPQDAEAQAAPGDAPAAAAPTPPVDAAPSDAPPAEPEPPVIQQLAPAMQDLLGEGARGGRPLVPPAGDAGARTANGTVDRSGAKRGRHDPLASALRCGERRLQVVEDGEPQGGGEIGDAALAVDPFDQRAERIFRLLPPSASAPPNTRPRRTRWWRGPSA